MAVAQARPGGMPATQTSKVPVAPVGSSVNKAGGRAGGCFSLSPPVAHMGAGLMWRPWAASFPSGAQGQFWEDEKWGHGVRCARWPAWGSSEEFSVELMPPVARDPASWLEAFRPDVHNC